MNCKFTHAYSPQKITEYYLRETEPRLERDQDLEHTLRIDPGEHDGTVPVLRRDLPERAADAMRIELGQTLTAQQVMHLLGGRRANGEPTGRRIVGEYTREDGVSPKPRDFIDVTLPTDISVGLALANAETRAGRAMILSAAYNAADDLMGDFERQMGFTRRGAGGKGGEEAGALVWMRFAHHATRPAADGSVAPSLHFHITVPNAVILPSGKIMAINMRRLHGNIVPLAHSFQNKFAERCREAGIDFKRNPNNHVVIFSDIPDSARRAMSVRSREIMESARASAERAGHDWERLDSKARRRFTQFARDRTEGPKLDGMATREIWQDRLRNFGVKPLDVARPRLTRHRPQAHLAPPDGILKRARALAERIELTWKAHRQIRQSADLRPESALSLRQRAMLAAGLGQPLPRQAFRLRQSMETLSLPSLARQAGARLKQSMWARLPEIRQSLHDLAEKMAHTAERIRRLGERKQEMSQTQTRAEYWSDKQAVNEWDRISVVGSTRYEGNTPKTVHQVAVTFTMDGDPDPSTQVTRFHNAVFEKKQDAEALAQKISDRGWITPEQWKDKEGSNNFIPAKIDRPENTQNVGKTETMLRVYARKVHHGEVSMNTAVTRFALAEERRDRIGVNPVHKTETYQPGGASPENRSERMEKWTDRIGDKVAALERGENIWPEVARGPDRQEPRQQMRQER